MSTPNSGSNKLTSQIFGLIKQYLEHFNFSRTLETLKIDVNNAGHTFSEPTKHKDNSTNSLQADLHLNELILMFSNGETEEFLTNFSRLVPKEVQLLDKTCILLLFELNLYFMTYPLRGNPNINQFRLQHRNFVQYLEEIAAHNEIIVNSAHARFLCLGLASISQHPLDNFMIKELLNPAWGRSLKERVTAFLKTVLPQQGAPLLEVLVEKTNKQTDKHTDKRLQQLEAKCIQYKSMFAKQQKEYYNVLAVATELVESLENAILGKGVDPSTIERVCIQLFQQQDVSASIHHLDFTRPGTASNMLRQSMVMETRKLETRKQETQEEQFETVAVLDMPKIKEVLCGGDDVEAGYLLQAVRWRITKSSTDSERETLLSQCVREDLFGKDDSNYSIRILDSFISADAEMSLTENFTRLIHCFCALSEGCVYLSAHTPLISHLILSLTSSTQDDVIRQVVLGALQTLSLTRAVQSHMLSTPDMMTWLLTLLSDPDELSEYTLHHTSALLMNLCLRTRGRIFLSENTSLLFTVVEGLMEHEAGLVREYVNGVLFSALNMKTVREKAREVGLEESIKLLIEISPSETSTQLQYCLDQMCNPASEGDPTVGDSEDEEEEVVEDNLDSLTMDLQLPESLELRPVQGEELLCSRYLTDINSRCTNLLRVWLLTRSRTWWLEETGDRRPRKRGLRGESPLKKLDPGREPLNHLARW
ncbi:lisH domain-containing protein ARMC9-like [Bolinopsis microptera]|uniref:lisH domain-containing protein ARMC9-like n=1 Tax=Bolinopsis microptera TaxID=2820187 RepID=UPI0030796D57